jgi:hypothetical protein
MMTGSYLLPTAHHYYFISYPKNNNNIRAKKLWMKAITQSPLTIILIDWTCNRVHSMYTPATLLVMVSDHSRECSEPSLLLVSTKIVQLHDTVSSLSLCQRSVTQCASLGKLNLGFEKLVQKACRGYVPYFEKDDLVLFHFRQSGQSGGRQFAPASSRLPYLTIAISSRSLAQSWNASKSLQPLLELILLVSVEERWHARAKTCACV